MLVLGIESSCDETGVALYDTQAGLLAQALHSQAAMHERYGGVVPELASRDHVERLTPLLEGVLAEAGRPLTAIDAIAYTQGVNEDACLDLPENRLCELHGHQRSDGQPGTVAHTAEQLGGRERTHGAALGPGTFGQHGQGAGGRGDIHRSSLACY